MKKAPRYISRGHAVTLAFWQLAQPANRETVFALVSKTAEGKKLTRGDFDKTCDKLEKESFLWKTRNDLFVVTPAGAGLANLALPSATRDKQRLFFLNRSRNFEVDA